MSVARRLENKDNRLFPAAAPPVIAISAGVDRKISCGFGCGTRTFAPGRMKGSFFSWISLSFVRPRSHCSRSDEAENPPLPKLAEI